MKILLSNDDGFDSLGISELYKCLVSNGHEVIVIAPDSEQSGVGHGFTYNRPLKVKESLFLGKKAWRVSGTPADCVKFGIASIMKERPDLVISGINDGNNSGIATFYSGTVAAAREAAFWNIPALAFSITEKGFSTLEQYAPFAADFVDKMERETFISLKSEKVFLNVNFPDISLSQTAGIKVTRQSMAFYCDGYKSLGDDRHQLYGVLNNVEHEDEFDTRAIMNNYITVTPIKFDATAYEYMDKIKYFEDTKRFL